MDGSEPNAGATATASKIIAHADRDMAFVVRLSGEGLDLLSRHFIGFIEAELARAGVVYGDHPLLRLFVETHSRELTEFVLSSLTLRHRFELRMFQHMTHEAMHMLRTDLWDSLRGDIEAAERHFRSGLGGMREILTEIEDLRKSREGVSAPGGDDAP
ncbi:hypothetical protein G3545_26590 [Starkeya sp. ORNL1]|uniref:hypothetical protein n=1 Tax=Starkeya sp. ORNL1 TaxID=2709380 RepID=UPI0014645A21|nr:hypothetical protein [Starkeya sp. ORNL1]QJP16892.1 hypothetical protein G3545_26590 [Starkeya sp. ORNL1]